MIERRAVRARVRRARPTGATSGDGLALVGRLVLVASVVLVAGCNSKTAATPENYTATLNTYLLGHDDCLLPESPRFPLETSDPVTTRQMDSLVTAQLLTQASEPAIHVSRYTPTTIGTRFAPRFCYGHREVANIVSSTPPGMANGFPETHIIYRYTMKDVPVWAKSAGVRAAFPAMDKEITDGGTGTATLARTLAGWQIPD